VKCQEAEVLVVGGLSARMGLRGGIRVEGTKEHSVLEAE